MSWFLWLLGAVRRSIRVPARSLTLVLGVFGLMWGSSAYAFLPKTFSVGGFSGTTAQAACDGYGTNYTGGHGVVEKNSGSNQWVCVTYNSSNGYVREAVFAFTCQTGSAVINPTNNGQAMDTMCTVAPPVDCTTPTLKNAYLGASVQGTSATLPSTICIQGCSYAAGGVGVQVGTSYATDIGLGTGANCTGANYDVIDTTTKKTDPPSLVSCQKQGKVYGTVNGVGICAAAGTIPNSTVTQNSTNTTQNTSASGVQAPAQTTGDTTTVSNVNGVPTVTRTVTNPDGSKSTTTQDQPSFCAQNPNAQVCKESNSNVSGGGDCSAAPVCQGDAVQCAMVNQQWHTRCDSNQANAQSALGAQILAGNDPVANPASAGQRTVSNISSSIDQTAFLSGGALADKVVTVHGNAITLPFSKLNQYLVWLGHIFVVISLIGGLRIVLGGFK